MITPMALRENICNRLNREGVPSIHSIALEGSHGWVAPRWRNELSEEEVQRPLRIKEVSDLFKLCG